MIEAPTRIINDVVADFLACRPSDEDVLSYFMPPDLQARAHFLLDLNGEDELTCEEARELDELGRADDLLSLLKAKISRRQRLGNLFLSQRGSSQAYERNVEIVKERKR